jgi:hypothetical protein
MGKLRHELNISRRTEELCEPLHSFRRFCEMLRIGQGWGGQTARQASFPQLEYANEEWQTRRELFLSGVPRAAPDAPRPTSAPSHPALPGGQA